MSRRVSSGAKDAGTSGVKDAGEGPGGGSAGVTDHTLLSNIGTTTHADIDAHIAASAGGGAYTLIYKEGAADGVTVFGTWAALITRLAALRTANDNSGSFRILFDNTTTQPMVIPVGAYDMTDVEWFAVGDLSNGTAGKVIVEIAEGVTFTGLRAFRGELVVRNRATSTVPCTDVSDDETIYLLDGAFIGTDAAGVAFYNLSSLSIGASAILTLGRRSGLVYGAYSGKVFDVSVDGSFLTIEIGLGCSVGDSCLVSASASAAVFVSLYSYSSAYSLTQANLTTAATITRTAGPKANATGSDPGVSDDTLAGYEAGSMWANTTSDAGFMCLDATAGAAVWTQVTNAAGGGDVAGPASSTDNAIARFDGTGGKTIQNSSPVIADAGNIVPWQGTASSNSLAGIAGDPRWGINFTSGGTGVTINSSGVTFLTVSTFLYLRSAVFTTDMRPNTDGNIECGAIAQKWENVMTWGLATGYVTDSSASYFANRDDFFINLTNASATLNLRDQGSPNYADGQTFLVMFSGGAGTMDAYSSDTFSGESFSGELTFAARQNVVYRVQAQGGTNWHITQLTMDPPRCVGSDKDNSAVTTIGTIDESVGVQMSGFVESFAKGFTAITARTGTITAAADGGGGEVDITSTAHGLATGDMVSISGTASSEYDGLYEVVGVGDADTFSITETFGSSSATGRWSRGIGFRADTGTAGLIETTASISCTAGNANVIGFLFITNVTAANDTWQRRKIGSASDLGALTITGFLDIVEDDVIWLACQNASAATDIECNDITWTIKRIGL